MAQLMHIGDDIGLVSVKVRTFCGKTLRKPADFAPRNAPLCSRCVSVAERNNIGPWGREARRRRR